MGMMMTMTKVMMITCSWQEAQRGRQWGYNDNYHDNYIWVWWWRWQKLWWWSLVVDKKHGEDDSEVDSPGHHLGLLPDDNHDDDHDDHCDHDDYDDHCDHEKERAKEGSENEKEKVKNGKWEWGMFWIITSPPPPPPCQEPQSSLALTSHFCRNLLFNVGPHPMPSTSI